LLSRNRLGFVTLLATKHLHRGRVRSQSVGRDLVWYEALVLEKFPEQLQCRGFVSPLLHQHVQDLTFLVDGPPHEHAFAVDAHDHLVQVPYGIGASTTPADVRSDRRPELVAQQRSRRWYRSRVRPASLRHREGLSVSGGKGLRFKEMAIILVSPSGLVAVDRNELALDSAPFHACRPAH
jgi:hypothetical protein